MRAPVEGALTAVGLETTEGEREVLVEGLEVTAAIAQAVAATAAAAPVAGEGVDQIRAVEVLDPILMFGMRHGTLRDRAFRIPIAATQDHHDHLVGDRARR